MKAIPMCLQMSVLLYLLHPGPGVLGPAAVRRCSGEVCRVCHSIAECRKVTLNLQLLILQLKILHLCTSFCFSIISLEFGIKCFCLFQIDHTLCLGTTSLCYIRLSSYWSHEWLSCVERGTTRKTWQYILIFILCFGKGCYKLIVEFNPKICHSKYLK